MTFGSYVRAARVRMRSGDPAFSVRKVDQVMAVEPAYLSKIERELAAPPSEAAIRVGWRIELKEYPDLLLAMAGKVVGCDLQRILLQRSATFRGPAAPAEGRSRSLAYPENNLREIRDGDWLRPALRAKRTKEDWREKDDRTEGMTS